MNFRLLLLFITTLILFSCGSDGNAPNIDVTSPENGTSFSPGDIINFAARVTDDTGVATVQVTSIGLGINVSNPITGQLLDVNYTLDITLIPETALDDYELKITAVDIDGNFSDEETISITVE